MSDRGDEVSAPELTAAQQAKVDRFGIMPCTRPWTPDEKLPSGGTRLRTKRCCNGCGSAIGDATTFELENAIFGIPLPDVRKECGCVPK